MARGRSGMRGRCWPGRWGGSVPGLWGGAAVVCRANGAEVSRAYGAEACQDLGRRRAGPMGRRQVVPMGQRPGQWYRGVPGCGVEAWRPINFFPSFLTFMFSHFLIFAVSEAREDWHVPKAYAHIRTHARMCAHMILL